MLFTTRSRYGLRLMLFLGSRYGSGLCEVSELSRAEDISVSYIHLLLNTLRTSGLVRSVRGRSGGYELNRPPSEISLFEVISVLDGHDFISDCVRSPEFCSRSDTCPTRFLWAHMSAGIQSFLENTNLKQLLNKELLCDSVFDFKL